MKQADFYASANLQPFRRDLSDGVRYAQQRDALLRHLGIVPALLRGRAILEFGPGHGENARCLLAYGPARLVLVEIAEECVEVARSLLAPLTPPGCSVDIIQGRCEDFPPREGFDLVIFEGVIPFEPDPVALLRQAACHVAPGGVLSITCIDTVSLFAEVLRRLVANLAAPPGGSLDQRADALVAVFSPHLATLAGMTRSHRHWVIDQMIHPWSGTPLSIADAARALADGFDLHGTSPRFLADWRWFRNIHGDPDYVALAQSQYLGNLHNLLDHRLSFAPRDADANQRLLDDCTAVFDATRLFEASQDPAVLDAALSRVAAIADQAASFSADIAGALEDFLAAVERQRRDGAFGDFGRFAAMFGRGQQYASFIRRGAPWI